MSFSNLLVIDDSQILVNLFKNLTGNEPKWVSTKDKHIDEILKDITGKANDIHAIFINAHLKCKNYPYRHQCDRHQCGGIELLKHIRLTKELGNARLLPIILGTLLPVEYYIRKNPDNVIILSPGCRYLFLPKFSRNAIRSVFEAVKQERFLDHETLEKTLKEFAGGFTSQDLVYFNPDPSAIPTRHDIRNKLGPAIFLKEFLPNVPENDPLVMEYKKISQELPIKKLSFLGKTFLGETKTQPEKGSFQPRIKKKRFLLIDDQHDIGWSYALYRGIFNIESIKECKKIFNNIKSLKGSVLCDSKGNVKPISSIDSSLIDLLSQYKQDGFFLCFSSFNEAEKFFSEIRNKFNKLIGKWVQKDKDMERLIMKNLTEQSGKTNYLQTQKELNEYVEKCLEAIPYDLVFLDIRLTEEDKTAEIQDTTGFKLLHQIKELNRGTPVILFTASERVESYKKALSFLADGYWIKCIDNGRELRELIDSCLEQGSKLSSIWTKITLLENKKWLLQWKWDKINGKRRVKKDKASDEDVALIISFLKEAFFLLRYGYKLKSLNTEEYRFVTNFVCILMGMIQEMRHKSSDNFIPFTKKGWKIVQEEYDIRDCDKEYELIRKFRNRASHFLKRKSQKPIKYKEAIKAIEFTLDNYLM